jgi:hypothetical protein
VRTLAVAGRACLYLALATLIIVAIAYQFTPPVTVDVGSGSDSPFVQGFSFREKMADGDFRWSGARSEIRLWGLGNQSGTLQLRLAAPRPASIARVQIYANGLKLGEIEPGAAFQEFTFPVDRATIGAGGDLIIALASDTFTQPPDTREVGVQVDYARFESGGAPVIPSPRALYLIALVLLAFLIARVWSGSALAAGTAAALVILVEAIGLAAPLGRSWGPARVETVWFAAPLFWFGLAALASALALAWALQRLSLTYGGAPLSHKTLRAVFAAMALAFAVRMVLATGPGFIVDVQDYVVWSYKTVTYGLGTAYTALDGLWIADQSPGLLYLLHAMGLVYRAVFSPDYLYPGVAGDPAVRAANALTTNPAVLADPVQRTLLRLPSLLADLATGALIFAAVSKTPSPPPLAKGGQGGVTLTNGEQVGVPFSESRTPAAKQRGEVFRGLARFKWESVGGRAAWLVALAYWFNPAVLWNGAYWGQTDAVHALLVLGAFLMLGMGRIGPSFFILGVAVLTKPQAAVFGPLLLMWAWRTPPSPPLRKGGQGGVPLVKGGQGGLPFFKWGGRSIRSVLIAVVAGALGTGLMLAPMVLAGGGSGMLAYLQDTIGHHPILSANAHNLWWLLKNGQIDIPDTSEIVAGIAFTYRQASLVLFAAVYLAVLAKAWRNEGQDYFALGAFVGFAFFMLPTEIHENYGYALLPLLALAMTRDKKWVVFYVAVSATMVLNYALSDPPLFALFGIADPGAELAFPRELNALANTVMFAAWALYLFARRGVEIQPEHSLAPQGVTR